MNNYVVVVGGGKDSVLVIKKIGELGLGAIVVDKNSNSPGMVCADKKIILSTYESKPIIRALKRFQNSQRKIVAAVTRSSGIPVITTAEISDVFNLPGAGRNAARILARKDSFAELCLKYRIPTANIKLNLKIREQIIKHLPCVVKPTLGFVGKQGVMLMRKESEIDLAIKDAKKASLNGSVLIEKYIPGIDIGLISVVHRGILRPCFFIKEQNKFDNNGRVDFQGFCLVKKLKEADKRKIIGIAQKIVSAANVKYSPFLASFRLTKNGQAIPIEVNLDFGGENVLENIVSAKTNLDFIRYHLKSILC